MKLRVVVLISVFCASVLPCYADFTLTPGVDMYMEYNDNIYLDSEDEEDDVIATVSPNISLIWETPRLDVSLFARVSMEKYLNNTEEDRIGAESRQSSTLTALARLYRQLFFLSVTDTYSRVPVDEGGRGGESNRTVNLTDSNILRINPYLQFPIMKDTRMNLGYTYTNQWYEEAEADDYISHLYSASLSRELSPRLSASLSASHRQHRPKDADKVVVIGSGGTYDYDQDNVSLSLSYQATERLHLRGSYGHTWLDYDVRGEGDTDVWSASADYEITSNYSVGTSYTKSVDVSVSDGTTKNNTYSAYLQYDDRFSLNFTLFVRNSDYVEIDREEDSYGAVLSGELPFDEKTGLTGLLRYTNYDQSGLEAEEYDRYGTRFSYYYETRLGRVSAGYIYNRTESDDDNGDYDNNILFISASLKF